MAETKKIASAKSTNTTEDTTEAKKTITVSKYDYEALLLELETMKTNSVAKTEYEKVVRAFNRLFDLYQKEQAQKLLVELLKDDEKHE